MFNILNYSFIHKSHNSSRGGGGVGIYIHNNYKSKEKTDFTIFADGIFESVFVENENTYLEKTAIGEIPRPPEHSNLNDFDEYIQSILHKLSMNDQCMVHNGRISY